MLQECPMIQQGWESQCLKTNWSVIPQYDITYDCLASCAKWHYVEPKQGSNYTWISCDTSCWLGAKSDPDGLLRWKEGLTSTYIGRVRDFFDKQVSPDTHPSSHVTLTRLTLHLNQLWHFLLVRGQVWPWWPVEMEGRVDIHIYWSCERLLW